MAKFNIAITIGVEGPGAKQVRDEFSKIGRSAKSVADDVGKLKNAIIAGFAAAGIGMAIRAVYENVAQAEKAMAQLRAGVASTGGAAGLSAEQLAVMAGELQRLTAVEDEVIMEAQGILLTFTKIGREAFPRATQAALDLSARLGTDLNSAALLVGKALNDPIKGLTAMGRAGVQFSESQKETIKSLAETGRIAEAQIIIFEELETQVGGSAAAFRDTLPGAIAALRGAWGNLLEEVGKSGESGGMFRTGIEGMVSGLEYLVDNWNLLESAVFDVLGRISRFLSLAVAYWLKQFAMAAHGIELLGKLAPISPLGIIGKKAGGVAGGIDALIKDTLQAGKDLQAGFTEKADRAATAAKDMGKAMAGAGGGAGELSGEAKKLAQELAELTADLKRSASQKLDLAKAYGFGPEAVKQIERTQALHNAYLKDVAKFGAAAARALAPLRAADYDAAQVAERAKEAWEGLEKATDVAADVIEKRFKEWGVAARKTFEETNRLFVRGFQSVKDLRFDADFAVRLSGIDETNDRLRGIEEQYLSFLRTLGEGSVEKGEEVFAQLATAFGYTVEQIKAWLGEIADEAAASRYRGASKTSFDLFSEERDNIKRLVEEGVLTAEDGAAATRDLQRDHWAQVLSDTSQFLDYMASEFGGFFGTLANFVSRMQQTMAALQSASGALGGLGFKQAAAGLASAAPFIAVMVAAYDAFKSHAASRQARKYETGVVVGMERGQWQNFGLEGQAAALSRQFRAAAEAFAEAIGGTLRNFVELQVQIRRDGKYFQAFVEGELIGKFESLEEATKAALAAAFRDPETLVSGLSDLVRQGLKEQGGLLDLDELQDFLGSLREIAELSWTDGARAVAESVRHFDDLWQSLLRLGEVTPAVQQGFADLVGAESDVWQGWRDSITGRQKTRQELLAEKQQEAKLFNAQKALRVEELKLWKLELEAEIKRLQGLGGTIKAGIGMRRVELEGEYAFLRGRAEFINAELSLNEEYIKGLQATIEAINAIIAALPTDIDFGEIRLPKMGDGGADDRKADAERLADILREHALSVLGEYGRALADLNEKWDEAKELAHGNKEKLEEVAQARREEIAALAEQASRMLIDPFLGAGGDRQAQLDEVLRQYEDLRQNYKELGIALWKINQAERNRLQLLGLEAAASIGDPVSAAILQFKGIGDTLAFLRNNLDLLNMSAEDFERIVDAVQANTFLDIADRMAQYIDDEQLRAELAEMRYDLEKAAMLVQIEMAKTFGAINEEQYRRLLELWGRLPGDLPVGAAGGGDTGTKRYRDWWGEQNKEAANELEKLVEAFADAKEGIREFLLGISTNQFGGINPEEAFRAAQAEWTRVLASAQRGEIAGLQGIPEAGRGFLDAMKAFSPALFATSLPGIQETLRGLLAGNTVTSGNLTYTERFVAQQAVTNSTLDRGFADLSSLASSQTEYASAALEVHQEVLTEMRVLNSRLMRLESQGSGLKVVGRR